MGSYIFESNPPIKGPSTNLSDIEQKYFSKVNTILHNNYMYNLYNDLNLEISLQKKSFMDSQIDNYELQDISWIDFILNHLEDVKKNHRMTWADDLKEELLKEQFLLTNKYLSDFFYKEYNIKTFPLILKDNNDNFFDNNKTIDNIKNNNNNKTYDINTTKKLNDADANSVKESLSYNELNVTNNLGGSYMEIKIDDLTPNDPTLKYVMDRNLVKTYIKIFKSHIYKDKNHPINKTIFLFNKIFSKFIEDNINDFKEKQRKQNLINENFENKIKKFEGQITKCLQDFILAMNCSLKLFYSTCINYSFFKEEKDDLINLVISLFFKTGKLYESLFDLYSLSYNTQIQALQEKLLDIKNIKPKSLDITDKYCLDEVTLNLEKDEIKEDDTNNINDINEIRNNIQIEMNDNILANTYEFKNKNKINETEGNNNILDNDKEDDDYLLSKLNDEDISIDTKNEGEVNYIRKTISNFNSKTYMFPQIRDKIRDTLAQNELYIQEVKLSNKLPMPYFSAINLLKKLRSFKTPFEKIIILAAINDQITESVMAFWSKMKKYIKSSYLFIESDELKAIFLYIFIKAQMPELLVECKIISNFTTQQTRGFNISYNLSMAEASIEKILEMKDTKEINKAEKELKEVRKTFGDLATQRFSRLSRLSRASAVGNPFS